MRWRLLSLSLLFLSGAALVVSLTRRDNLTDEGGWTSYTPLSEHRTDGYATMSLGDPTVWLGAAAAFALAAVLVLAAALIRPKGR